MATIPWKKVLVNGGFALLCASGIGLGFVTRFLTESKVAGAFSRQAILNTPPEEVFDNQKALTILLLGCDADVSYGGKKILKGQARSDTMLVAKVDFSARRITGLGLPRDLLVEVPGYHRQKINAYHAIGGKPLAQKAAEEALGIKIDRTITLDYPSFMQMVDLVGGVDVFIPKRMKYQDLRANPPLKMDFKPGRQRLNGYDAMCFVRFRHSDDTFQRQTRQLDFMLAFKDTLRAQPQLLGRVADKALSVLGDGFSSEEVAALARFAQGVPKDQIRFGSVPVLPAANYNLELDRGALPDTLTRYNLTPTRAVTRL